MTMTSYGQFCPIAKAMEVLDERWTLLVVRELLLGSTRFNELRRGVPKMSPALLSKRLRSLTRAGIITRAPAGYRLTSCGAELIDVVTALGVWGTRWIGELGEEDLDPHLLLWDLRRTVPVTIWPRSRTTVAIRFDDIPRATDWWLVVTGDEADLCDYDPGFDVTVTIRTGLATLTRIWRGDLSWDAALRAGRVRLDGPEQARRALPTWIGQSTLAATPRPLVP